MKYTLAETKTKTNKIFWFFIENQIKATHNLFWCDEWMTDWFVYFDMHDINIEWVDMTELREQKA